MRHLAMMTVAALAMSAGATGNGGALHDIDVVLEVNEAESRIVTNRVGDGGSVVAARVFDVDPVLFFGFPFAEDPGFDTVLGTFQGGSVVQIDMLDALRVWNGADFDAIHPDPLELGFGAAFLSPATADTRVAGPQISVPEEGDIHVHPTHIFDEALPEGLYLMTFDISNTALSDRSEPFWFVYRWVVNSDNLTMLEEEQQVAMQWVLDNLATNPCPADIDGDGAVGSSDLALLLGSWGGSDASVDLDESGMVGSADLALLLGSWGPCS